MTDWEKVRLYEYVDKQRQVDKLSHELMELNKRLLNCRGIEDGIHVVDGTLVIVDRDEDSITIDIKGTVKATIAKPEREETS